MAILTIITNTLKQAAVLMHGGLLFEFVNKKQKRGLFYLHSRITVI